MKDEEFGIGCDGFRHLSQVKKFHARISQLEIRLEIAVVGEIDDRFYIVVSGSVRMSRGGETAGTIPAGGCFGEASYAEGAHRETVAEAQEAVTLLKVTATLIEQVSISCQLRFNKVFLRELIGRLQRGNKKSG